MTVVFVALLAVFLHGAILDDAVIDRLNLTRISGNAWPCCISASFGQPVETFGNRQYAVFYDNLGNVCVGRRRTFNAQWDTLRVAGYITSTTDGHNTPVLGICPLDGTLHIAWDHHNDPLHYSVSVKGLATSPDSFSWNGSLFGPVRSSEVMPGLNVVTYPHFLTRPDGELQFITRLNGGSGNADWALWEYSADSSKWASVGVILSQVGTFIWPDSYVDNDRCAYPNGYTYHNNRFHLTWCWREDCCRQNANHDLMYAYSDDFGRTWRSSAGDSVGAAGSNPMKLATPGIKVWDIPVNRGYINQVCQNVDSRGRVHVVTWHVRDSSADDQTYYPPNGWYFHYWRDTTGIWRRDSVMAIQERCKILFDGNDNAFLITASAAVYGATASSGWTDWTQVVNENIGGGEPTIDFSRWRDSRVLSLMSANLSVLDLAVSPKTWPVIHFSILNGSNSSGLGGAVITLKRDDGFFRGGLTDSTGQCLIRLDTGAYHFLVSKTGFEPETAAIIHHMQQACTLYIGSIYLQPLPPIRLKIRPESPVLNLYDSIDLTAWIVYPDNSESPCLEHLTWVSRSPSFFIQVDSTGRVRSFGAGGTAARIVCTADSSGLRDSIYVMVNPYRMIVLYPEADAYVRDGAYAVQNFGSEAALMTKTGDIDYTRWSFLKFSLDSLAGLPIVSATLMLYVTATDITSSMPVTAYGVDDVAWTEDSLAWNNRPLPGAAQDTTVITPMLYQYCQWDVTDWAVSCQAGGLMSLCLLDTTRKGNNVVYASRESAVGKPVLVVATAPDMHDESGITDAGLSLSVRPNPFNPTVNILVHGTRGSGSISIFTPSGRRVTCLDLDKGAVEWNAAKMPSGIYLIRASVGVRVLWTKAILLR